MWYFTGILSACKYDGKLVAMPHHTDTMAMFYNKRMFEEAGIRIPTSVEDGYTWEELILQEQQRKIWLTIAIQRNLGEQRWIQLSAILIHELGFYIKP